MFLEQGKQTGAGVHHGRVEQGRIQDHGRLVSTEHQPGGGKYAFMFG